MKTVYTLTVRANVKIPTGTLNLDVGTEQTFIFATITERQKILEWAWEALFNKHYWEFVNSESFQIGDVYASQYDGDRHTRENPNYDLAKANAHLIAAAPDLLEALKGLVNEFGLVKGPLIRAALAAIAKAEGS
jgi:hypothetical protein